MNYTLISRFVLIMAALALNACQKDLTDIELVQRAKDFQDNGELVSAVIDLKNAAIQNPENPEARWLLGKLYVELGNGEAGEKELRRANQLGIDFRSLVVPLGKALHLQGKYQEVLDEAKVKSDDSPAAKAKILAIRGDALRDLRRLDFAEREYLKAIEFDAEYLSSYVGLSRLYLRKGDDKQAEKFLNQAKNRNPEDQSLLLMEGDLNYYLGQYERSQEAYSKLLQKDKRNALAGLGLSLSLLAQKEVEEAVQYLDRLLQIDRNHLYTNYLRGLAAFELKDYESAKKHTELVLAQSAAHIPSLLVAGATNFALEEYEQAVSRLERVVAAAPAYQYARMMLGETHRRLGNELLALEILKPLAAGEVDDAGLLAGIGRLAAKTGNLEEANEYFLKAATIQPDNARIRALLGLNKLSLGDLEEGLSDLSAAEEMAPESGKNKAILIQNLLKAEKYKEALSKARELQALAPDKSIGYVYAGIAHMKMEDHVEAEELFKKALEINPKAQDAAINLGVLYKKIKREKETVPVLETALKNNPDSPIILRALARQSAEQGDVEKTRKHLELLVEKYPKDNMAVLWLARFYLMANEPDNALNLTKPLLREYPEELALMEVVARAELVKGNYDAGVEILRTLIMRAPRSPNVHYWYGLALKQTGQEMEAAKALEKAIAIVPSHRDARILLADIRLRQGKNQEVKELFSEFNTDNSTDRDVLFLGGKVALLDRDYERAISLFSQAQNIRKESKTAVAIALTHIAQGNKDAGEKALQNWLDGRPESKEVRYQLATFYQQENRSSDAMKQYKKLTELDDGNWVYHNELAMLAYTAKDIKLAEKHALKAYNLNPQSAFALDTYALIMMKKGKNSEALRLFKRANEAMPDIPEIELHLAQSLIKNDQQQAATEILNRLKSISLPESLQKQVKAEMKRIEIERQ